MMKIIKCWKQRLCVMLIILVKLSKGNRESKWLSPSTETFCSVCWPLTAWKITWEQSVYSRFNVIHVLLGFPPHISLMPPLLKWIHAWLLIPLLLYWWVWLFSHQEIIFMRFSQKWCIHYFRQNPHPLEKTKVKSGLCL